MIFRRENDAARTSTATAPRKHNRLRAALITGAIVAAPVAGLAAATTASAATPSTWDAVAQCESSGNWSANTGNGFYGGLQFTPSTWAAYGGTQYAASADQASASQQISVAENVLASQGPGAWPVCGPQAGLSSADASDATGAAATSPVSTPAASTPAPSTPADDAAPAPAAAPAHSSVPASGDSYTVKSGDTLGSIAAANDTTWQSVYAANSGTIGGNPDLIIPGQVLTVG